MPTPYDWHAAQKPMLCFSDKCQGKLKSLSDHKNTNIGPIVFNSFSIQLRLSLLYILALSLLKWPYLMLLQRTDLGSWLNCFPVEETVLLIMFIKGVFCVPLRQALFPGKMNYWWLLLSCFFVVFFTKEKQSSGGGVIIYLSHLTLKACGILCSSNCISYYRQQGNIGES